MDNRQEILISDLYSVFGPKEEIGIDGDTSKWYSMPYRNEKYSGRFISSMITAPSCDATYDPELCGWYKIFVAFPGMGNCRIHIKLTDDARFSYITTSDAFSFEEMLWKCADMTNQQITLKRGSTLASLRFVPMSDEEVEAYKLDLASRQTKHLYIADDMFHSFVGSKNINDWLTNIDHYKDTDTEWFSPECPHENFDEFHFELRKAFVDRAHELGFKVAHSLRMGLWGLGFPHVLKGAGGTFTDSHPDCHCVDRNGDVITAMSYAYPEVRKYVIDKLVRAAQTGGEAVTLLACRGVPYVLFEKPVADRFFEKYGEYPYEYPLDDPKLRSVHCELMTEFFQDLRDALDNEFGKDKIQIHIRGFNTIEDFAYLGFDLKELARRNLVNLVMTHPRRFIEFVPDEIKKDHDEVRIDIEKYNDYILHEKSADLQYGGHNLNYENSRGEQVGPESIKACLEEWEAYSKEYNIPIYYEICEYVGDEESFRNTISMMHEMGINRFTLFNAVCLVVFNYPVWSVCKQVCHKGMLNDKEKTPSGYTKLRVHTVGDCYYNRFLPIWGG